jgi:hypothetical protein
MSIYLGYNDKVTRKIERKKNWRLLGIWPRMLYDRNVLKKENRNQNY